MGGKACIACGEYSKASELDETRGGAAVEDGTHTNVVGISEERQMDEDLIAERLKKRLYSAADSGHPEDEEKSNDPVDEEDNRMRTMQRSRNRRSVVSADAIQVDQAQIYVPPVYEKSIETKARVTEILNTSERLNVLFGHLDGTETRTVIDAMYFKEVTQGDVVIKEGDEGDAFYIVDQGMFSVIKTKGGEASKVAELCGGAFFGELALMYHAPRTATITCITPTAGLWCMDRDVFRMTVVLSSAKKVDNMYNWLKEVEILKPLGQSQLVTLTDLLKTEVYADGEAIINQGDIGDNFYILVTGEATAFIQGAGGEVEVKQYKEKGEYFGEIALLTDCKRMASVRCSSKMCKLAFLERKDFDSVLGPLSDILRDKVGEYGTYSEFINR
eukprot:GEMP01019603.1.p1 GENE.GEMP01019603.1~~GEMP01019603.1.p1  ORF type:complete len:388 (+),score=94.20 GEMP01019603.1:193-1356(+)